MGSEFCQPGRSRATSNRKAMERPLLLLSVLAVAAVVGSPIGSAQSADDAVRLKYTDEDAPRATSFGILIDNVFEDSLHSHDGHYHVLEAGAVETTDLEKVFDYLVLLWLERDKEYGNAMIRMLCPKDSPKPSGRSVFMVFDALDDLRHALKHKYYAIAKSELVVRYSFDLDKALDEMPIGFTEIWMHNELSYDGDIQAAEDVAKSICETGNVSVFTRSEESEE